MPALMLTILLYLKLHGCISYFYCLLRIGNKIILVRLWSSLKKTPNDIQLTYLMIYFRCEFFKCKNRTNWMVWRVCLPEINILIGCFFDFLFLKGFFPKIAIPVFNWYGIGFSDFSNKHIIGICIKSHDSAIVTTQI